jgi:hypothetical protein
MLIAALIFLVVVLVSVATVLLYISGMSSKSNGWTRLAELYRLDGPFPERRVGFLTTTLNGYVLQHLMVVGIGEKGLGLRPIQLFRAFHPSLLIPWARLSTSRREGEFGVSFRVELGQPEMRIEWSEETHRKLLAEVPEGWPAARAALTCAG